MSRISFHEIECLPFWINYFGCSCLALSDEGEDISVSERMEELCTQEICGWWKTFTGWYDGALDESDGYLDDPTFLEAPLAQGKTLKIEFHPGDTLYFVDGEEIGSTGPHWKLGTVPYKELEELLPLEHGRQLFLLLLPLASLEREDASAAQWAIKAQMMHYFDADLCEDVSRCLVSGLVGDRS
ncbi:hypothetical protein D7V91_02550 [bacterium 1xD42-67]|nr:hypothetical protein D7V91_02550 [bacterium 1xD42-67]